MTVRDLQHLALRTSASPDMENKTMPRSTLNESEQKVCKVGQDSTSVVSAPTNLKSSKLQLRGLDDERKKSSEKRLINRIEIGHRNELDIRVTPMQKSLQLEDLRKLFTKLAQTRMHWEKNDHVLECHICLRTFSLFFRRHHCRICGRIFCNNCTLKVGSDLMPISGRPRVGHIRMCYGCRSTVDEALSEDNI